MAEISRKPSLIVEAPKGPDPAVIYRAKNPIATYIDDYGDERIIHAPKGKNSALRRLNMSDTPSLRMNRAVSILMGRKIRARRLALGYSQRQVCIRAGLASVSPKQYMNDIEHAKKGAVRMGTLYILALALDCQPSDLLPSSQEVCEMAGLGSVSIVALEAA